MFSHYSKKEKQKLVFNIITYCVFIFMMATLLFVNLKDGINIIILFILCFIALCLCLYKEYLNYYYLLALYELNYEIKPEKALETFERVIQKDITHTYEKDRGLFDVMVASNLKQYDKVIELIKKDEDKFNSSVEMLLVKDYFLMKAYAANHKTKESLGLFNDVKSMEKMKKRPEPIQFEMYYGLHYLCIDNLNKAFDHFSKVDRTRINPKENKELLEYLVFTCKNDAKKQRLLKELNGE